MSKVVTNEIDDINTDSNIVKKLSNELNELKQILSIRMKRGTLEPVQRELMKLREENNQLKKYFNGNDAVQKLIKENMFLKAELKKLTTNRTQNINNNNNNYDYYDNGPFSMDNTMKTKSTPSNYSSKPKNLLLNYDEIPHNNLAVAGREIVNTITNESVKGKHSYNEVFSTDSGSSKRIIGKEIKRVNARLRMLDDLEQQNRLKTQKLIEEITNRNIKTKQASRIRLVKSNY